MFFVIFRFDRRHYRLLLFLSNLEQDLECPESTWTLNVIVAVLPRH
jgi:hypothetical protein